ncbi:MAG: hypothetical protein GY859_34255, partial [Desulfobacterales bacterium]|nr:hypothetical protein [Desulfobacterales bacterium]
YVATASEYDVEFDDANIFRSADGGNSWSPMIDGQEAFTYSWYETWLQINHLAVAPTNPDKLVLGHDDVYISTNGGANPVQVMSRVEPGDPRRYTTRGDEMMWVLSMAADPRPEYASRLYAGYADTVLFRTDDLQGFRRLHAYETADPIPDLAAGWGDLADLAAQTTLDPDDPDTVYMSASWRLFKSADAGENWTELTGWQYPYGAQQGNDFRDGACRFAIDPGSPRENRVIFATVYAEGVFKSTNGGATWTDITNKFNGDGLSLSGVYIDPSNSNRVYIGTFSLLWYSRVDDTRAFSGYRTEDGGVTWVPMPRLPPVNRFWIDPENGDHLLACAVDGNNADNKGGIYRSEDRGATWSLALAQPAVTDVALDPHHADVMYALSSARWELIPGQNAGVYKSEDRGETWSRLDLGLNFYALYPLVIHPTRPDELFVGTAGRGVMRVLLQGAATPADPTLDIKANSENGPVTVQSGAAVAITLSLSPGDRTGQNADWWIADAAPGPTLKYLDIDTISFLPGLETTHQGPLVPLQDIPLPNLTSLTSGLHTFYFVVDMNMNGVLDGGQAFFDSISVTVSGEEAANKETP